MHVDLTKEMSRYFCMLWYGSGWCKIPFFVFCSSKKLNYFFAINVEYTKQMVTLNHLDSVACCDMDRDDVKLSE